METGQLLWSLCAMRYAKHAVSIFGTVDLLTGLELPEQLSPSSPRCTRANYFSRNHIEPVTNNYYLFIFTRNIKTLGDNLFMLISRAITHVVKLTTL